MRIGFPLAYAGDVTQAADQVVAVERAGADVVWVAEAYGFDAVSVLGYLAARTETIAIGSAILNVYSRTPALLAQVAAGLDAVSGGRFELGLGASGPQVIEGWHGLPYRKPVARTREVVDLVRRMLRREVIEHDGDSFTLPLPPEQGTGLGKPLKMLTRPVRDEVPILLAALGSKNVELTAEVADGWLPIFFHPGRARETWGAALDAGAAKREAGRGALDVVAGGMLAIAEGEEREALLDLARPMYALYIGGMGAKGRNFYNDLVTSYGYGDAAAEIQDLYLEGRKDEAAALVPRELIEATNLVGSPGFVQERIAAYREAGVTTLNVTPVGDAPALVEQVKGWVS
ncbi:LLM class F420-dependent oxidoreductase [Nitriliruptoraceae bacterium ZYF776]|nr:LLM class F420-dependent oxidoreductase [Profundirhabdus halotolerans]